MNGWMMAARVSGKGLALMATVFHLSFLGMTFIDPDDFTPPFAQPIFNSYNSIFRLNYSLFTPYARMRQAWIEARITDSQGRESTIRYPQLFEMPFPDSILLSGRLEHILHRLFARNREPKRSPIVSSLVGHFVSRFKKENEGVAPAQISIFKYWCLVPYVRQGFLSQREFIQTPCRSSQLVTYEIVPQI